MKKIITITALLTLFSCTKKEKKEFFNGYVVFKEYIPEHYGKSNEIIYQEANLLNSPAVKWGVYSSYKNNKNNVEEKNEHKHEQNQYERVEQFFESKFKIWVANKNEVVCEEIDSLYYVNVKCGEKVEIKYNYK